jgi:hypothetical protein
MAAEEQTATGTSIDEALEPQSDHPEGTQEA